MSNRIEQEIFDVAKKGLSNDLYEPTFSGRCFGEKSFNFSHIGNRSIEKKKLILSYALSLNTLGVLLQDSDNLIEARKVLEEALQIMEGAKVKEDDTYYGVLNNLGGVLLILKENERACELFNRSKEFFEKNRKTETAVYSNILSNLAEASKNDIVTAKMLYKLTLEIQKRVFGEESNEVSVTYNNIATLNQKEGRILEAYQNLSLALNIMRKLYSGYHPLKFQMEENFRLIWEEMKKTRDS
jgi:tetratricopeptide (TPR) repeat protein